MAKQQQPLALDTITRLYRSCDPNEALEAGDPRYVHLAEARGEPFAGWRHQLIKNIRRANQATTFLVSGFLGDGKTTELKRVQDELEKTDPKMAVVYVDGSLYLNAFDYSFNEVLLAVIAETGIQLREKYQVDLVPGYAMKKLHDIKSALLSEVELKEIGGEVSGGPYKASAKIALKARDQDETRRELWKLLAGDRVTLVEEFARAVNEQARPALRKKGHTDLVIVIDWLEKLVCKAGTKPGDPNSHEELFLHHAPLFQSFGAHLVLTLPIDMAYSAVQERLTAVYGQAVIVISGVQVADFFPDAEREKARSAMQELLRLRCEQAPAGPVPFAGVFADADLANDLIVFSGGHPRQLLILVRECCSFLDALPLTRPAFVAAKKKETQAAGRKVAESWFPKLAAIYRTHRIGNDADHLEMLRNLCVFAYANGEPQYAVDPAIIELKKMREALQAYDKTHREIG